VRDRALQLVLFARAYGFLRVLVNTFYQDLTNDLMQQLRTLALANADHLLRLIIECQLDNGDGSFFPDETQRQGLADLWFAMGTLGDPAAWTNPDGSRKSIADFIGPESAAVLATLDEILDATNGTSPAVYEQEAQAASAAVVAAVNKLAQARVQLAGWLD
jgi:hypothetical protein